MDLTVGTHRSLYIENSPPPNPNPKPSFTMHFSTALIFNFLLVLFALQQITVNGDSAEDYAKNLKVPPRFGKRADATDYGTQMIFCFLENNIT